MRWSTQVTNKKTHRYNELTLNDITTYSHHQLLTLSIGVPKYPRCLISNQNAGKKSRLIGLALRRRMAFGSVQTNTNIPKYGISVRNPFGMYYDLQKNIIKINAFIRHNTFIHIRHSSVTLIEQTAIYWLKQGLYNMGSHGYIRQMATSAC